MRQRDYIFFLINLLAGLSLQLLVAESRGWSLYLVSYPYVLPLLLLPMQAPKGWQLIAAAALGLVIDALYDTIGVHMAASVAMTYGRQLVLVALTPASLRESRVYPRAVHMGWGWYLAYLFSLLFLHQFCIFSLEAGTLSHTLYILFMLFRSLLLTAALCCVIEGVRSLSPNKRT